MVFSDDFRGNTNNLPINRSPRLSTFYEKLIDWKGLGNFQLSYYHVWCFAPFDTIFFTLKNVKNFHGGVLLSEKLQASAPFMGVFHIFLNCTNGKKLRKFMRDLWSTSNNFKTFFLLLSQFLYLPLPVPLQIEHSFPLAASVMKIKIIFFHVLNRKKRKKEIIQLSYPMI